MLSQVNHLLVGDVSELLAMLLPLLLGALSFAVGQLAGPVKAAKPCSKCGTQVSVRADPELSAGSQMCSQCVSVFTKKSSLVPALKARKQLEISRWESRKKAISTGLTLICAGLGHVFSGEIIQGVIFALLFITPLVGLLFRDGLVRAEYDALPQLTTVLPLVVVALLVYLLALRLVRKMESSS